MHILLYNTRYQYDMMITNEGAEVAMVGCVGDDDHGRAYQANFERRGIDTSGLRIAPGESTGVASIFVDTTTGENKIAVFFGANEFMTKERVEQQRSLFRASISVLHSDLKEKPDHLSFSKLK